MTNSIQIDSIRIAGFRGIQNMEMTLSRVTILTGPNNSGKTSVLKALQLALGNYGQYLSEEDFFIDQDDNRIKEITIDVKFVPVDGDKPVKNFNDTWTSAFGDKIKPDINGNDFVAIRTKARPDEVKGGFEISRYIMQKWPKFSKWQDEQINEKDKMKSRIAGVSFIPVESQRDIYNELKTKNSFVGRVLSGIQYDKTEIEDIEKQIQNINQTAVQKSTALKDLKKHLQKLNKAFQGKGGAEVNPFPKKIRDLAKNFSIDFGDKETGIFSMEYHGMGTRSWASMLTVQAFIDLAINKHEKELEPFFPIFSAEEPEAHLHPNAQKSLYRQIINTKGQIIISTHSPYFVSSADISSLRSLLKTKFNVIANDISKNLNSLEVKKVSREIISRRGDILFAQAWILCEGTTEEQIIPAMFELWAGKTLFDLGISCIGINGHRHYGIFLKFAHNIGIPAYIISDNDTKENQSTKENVKSQVNKFKKATGSDCQGVFFLSEGNNLENELLAQRGLKDEIKTALEKITTDDSDNKQYIEAKKQEISKWPDEKIKEKLNSKKATYASFLSDIIRENPNNKSPEDLIPKPILNCFNKIKEDMR